jgi:hypothetical protein
VVFTRKNSELLLSPRNFGRENPEIGLLPDGKGQGESSLRVTREMNFDTHREEALAAMAAAAVQNLATGFGFHAGAESVLLLAGPL